MHRDAAIGSEKIRGDGSSTLFAPPAKIIAMTRSAAIIGMIQGVVLAGFAVGLVRRWFPLGVPGEWEWLRLPASTGVSVVSLAIAAIAVLAFAGFAALGARSLGRAGSSGREAVWVAVLALASVLVQGAVQEGAPEGYGLAKWIIALQNSGSSGYQTVARLDMPSGLGAFLQAYPTWIKAQDSLHIGTHPPGLFVVAWVMGDLTRSQLGLARWVVDYTPGSAKSAVLASRASGLLGRDEAAALVLTGALTLLGSALTVIPLYLLARASGSAPLAWASATLWPLMPATLMFQPAADTAFPLLAASAMAAAAWAVRSRFRPIQVAPAVGSGAILAVGMELTLAYLAVGLVVAILLMATPGSAHRRDRIVLVVAVGLGFLAVTAAWWAVTLANPFSIWWTNQEHHARFYQGYPRSRLAWSWVNLVESTVAIGLASAVWAVAGLRRPARAIPTASWATLAVLATLTASGRSLSEVARLWLPMYPAILLLSATAWERTGAGPSSLAWSVGLVGCQTLLLQCMIQVVYPV